MPEIYRDASPITHATPDDPPTFFFHGDSDLLVPDSNSNRLYERLRELEVATERFIAKHQGHMATFINLTAVDAGIKFAKQQLEALPELR